MLQTLPYSFPACSRHLILRRKIIEMREQHHRAGLRYLCQGGTGDRWPSSHDLARPAGALEDGKVTRYFYQSLYLPHKGMFCEMPANLALGRIQVCFQLRNKRWRQPYLCHIMSALHDCKYCGLRPVPTEATPGNPPQV